MITKTCLNFNELIQELLRAVCERILVSLKRKWKKKNCSMRNHQKTSTKFRLRWLDIYFHNINFYLSVSILLLNIFFAGATRAKNREILPRKEPTWQLCNRFLSYEKTLKNLFSLRQNVRPHEVCRFFLTQKILHFGWLVRVVDAEVTRSCFDAILRIGK